MRGLALHGWRRLGFRRQFVLMLVAATLLSTVGMVAAAYMGARANAIGMAQAREAQDLRVAWQVLGTHGSGVLIQKGQLQTTNGYVFNGDHGLVNQITALAGDQAAIYELENDRLVLVASDLHTSASGTGVSGAQGTTLGTTLGGPAYQAVLGNCLASPAAAPNCYAGYRGPVTIQRTGYVAAIVPLMDAQGNLVGALAVATPAEAIEAPLRTLAGLLLLSGLLLMALFIVIGYRISDPVSRRAFTALATGLEGIDGVAARLGTQARTQAGRAGRQTMVARHLTDELRTLNELATAIENGAAMLQEATGGIWAELSHPGALVDAQTCLRTARHAAVVGGQLGVSAEQAFELCRRMRTTVNHVIAESGALRECGDETALAAAELRDALERAEAALGNRSMPPGSVAGPHADDAHEERRFGRVKELASPALSALSALTARLGGARDDETNGAAADQDGLDVPGARYAQGHAQGYASGYAPGRYGAARTSDEEHPVARAPRPTRPIDLPSDVSGERASGYTVLGGVGAWQAPGGGQMPGGAREAWTRPDAYPTSSAAEHHAPEFRAPRPPRHDTAGPTRRDDQSSLSGHSGPGMSPHPRPAGQSLARRPGAPTAPGRPASPRNPRNPRSPADPGQTGPGWRTPTGQSSAADGHPASSTAGLWESGASGQRSQAPGGGQWPNRPGR